MLVLEETKLAPDGYSRVVRSVNGTVPGPVIRVTVGDRLLITVINHLKQPSSLHWHGVDQQGQGVYMDGVPFLTQCPISPGGQYLYNFTAENAGTMWYHGHSGTQRVDGLAGALIIEDPHDPIQVDQEYEYVLFLQDWYHEWSDVLFDRMVGPNRTFPISIYAITFNGKAQCTCSELANCTDCDSATAVDLESFSLEKEQKYRFRIISGKHTCFEFFSLRRLIHFNCLQSFQERLIHFCGLKWITTP